MQQLLTFTVFCCYRTGDLHNCLWRVNKVKDVSQSKLVCFRYRTIGATGLLLGLYALRLVYSIRSVCETGHSHLRSHFFGPQHQSIQKLHNYTWPDDLWYAGNITVIQLYFCQCSWRPVMFSKSSLKSQNQSAHKQTHTHTLLWRETNVQRDKQRF